MFVLYDHKARTEGPRQDELLAEGGAPSAHQQVLISFCVFPTRYDAPHGSSCATRFIMPGDVVLSKPDIHCEDIFYNFIL